MKNLILLLTVLIIEIMPAIGQPKVEIMKNETIVKLTQAKIQEAVIIQKINKSVCHFDVSTDALINLRENNVTDNVINLMIAKQDEIDSSNENLASNNSTEKKYVFKESGIYFLENGVYTMLDPTNVGAATLMTGGCIGSSYEYKSQIDGGEANYHLKEKRPSFYFNFEPVKKSLNSSNQNTTTSNNYMQEMLNRVDAASGNSKAISPNDFKLIKLDKSKGKRKYTSGKISGFSGADMSIGGKYIITFKYEKVSGHTYKMTLLGDLKPGEYCFLYSNKSSVSAQGGSKVFDFGIKE